MNSMKKKILCLIIVSCLVFVTVSCRRQSTDDRTYHFNVSFSFVEPMNRAQTEILDRIQANSNGRIDMTYFHAWSLSSLVTVVDDINAGFTSMGNIPVSEHFHRLPYTSTATYLPMLGYPHMLEIGPMFDDLFEELHKPINFLPHNR